MAVPWTKNPENLGDIVGLLFFFGRNMGIKLEIRDFTAKNGILPTTMGILPLKIEISPFKVVL
jgi:hypothetical protein